MLAAEATERAVVLMGVRRGCDGGFEEAILKS